ncbi:MAG: response regulator [Bacteroidota bacterium]
MKNLYNFSGKTVLITEDDVLNFLVLSAFLEGTGATVLHAETGSEAIEYFDLDTEIDLVLIDVNLPGMDGLKVTKYIKHKHPDIPIIIHSSLTLEELKRMTLNTGYDDYIEKPVKKDDFLKKAEYYILNIVQLENSKSLSRQYYKTA